MRIIIAGSRNYNNYKELSEVADKFFDDIGIEKKWSTIITGGAKGADKLGEKYALDNILDSIVFEAKWGKYGNAAGIIRNGEMAKNADCLLAFWDGRSKGTKDMIDKAFKRQLRIRVFNFETKEIRDYGHKFKKEKGE